MTRPTILTVKPNGIPAELKAERRWTCWRLEWDQKSNGNGRWTKRPCMISGRYAKPNDPSTWTTFDQVLAAYQAGGFDGLGFCLGDGWAGIDIDHCRENDDTIERARAFTDALYTRGHYIEVSPSGTGYKLIGRSPRTGGQVDFGVTPPAFTRWAGARFFAITGDSPDRSDATLDLTPVIDLYFPAKPLIAAHGARPAFIRPGDVRGTENIETLTDDQVCERILATPQADKFCALMRGDTSGYGNDHSRADQALVCILLYWAGDLDQVDRLFRKSKLMRPKWNTASYRRATLDKAVLLMREVQP
jgi:primase-polymerase (primpol)-like protein